MRAVQRAEIVDYVTYNEQRAQLREAALAAKRLRRVVVADCLTFLFENHETIRYQIQEMMRVEQIVRERDILHEIATYNELLGHGGDLGVTVLIGFDDPQERDLKLSRWQALPQHLYLVGEDGRRIRATWDPRQVSERRLSSVQYLKFAVQGAAPVACGVDFAGELVGETALTADQREALRADLAERD
ncbi:Protein of unknown function [Nannocystis exedens]|uniref:DUF3501 family protein n=1 Tax=Nannocystis exedens TaxID=54 RepID=A0A1I1XZP5_9BACT|nr:DUF3501 family protein [Nannocystis exedens]PCC71732.1 hypothetical protein NAEX_04811 [Nannocystis exedens]SFE12905.1 Protein of unknown function [Nannocystis exedens]